MLVRIHEIPLDQLRARADQEVDVGDAPQPPRQRTSQPDPAEIDDRASLANLGKTSLVAVHERQRRGITAQPRLDGGGDVLAFLLGSGCNPRRWLSVRSVHRHGIADGKYLGVTGHRKVGHHLETPHFICRSVQPLGGGRGADACGPDDRLCCQPDVAISDAVGGAVGNCTPEFNLDAKLAKRAQCIVRQIVGISAKHALASLNQHDPGLACVNLAEFAPQRVPRQFGYRSGQFHAGGTSANDDEGQKGSLFFRIGLPLGPFKCQQDASPDRCRVLQRLQAERIRLPLVVAEIGMSGAGGQHQGVIGQRCAIFEQHEAAFRIDTRHVGEHGRNLRPVPHKRTNRPGDLGCGQRGCRNLIEQWLKEVMITPVDESDVDRCPSQPLDDLQPAEARADDHYSLLHGGVLYCLGTCERRASEPTHGLDPYGISSGFRPGRLR